MLYYKDLFVVDEENNTGKKIKKYKYNDGFRYLFIEKNYKQTSKVSDNKVIRFVPRMINKNDKHLSNYADYFELKENIKSRLCIEVVNEFSDLIERIDNNIKPELYNYLRSIIDNKLFLLSKYDKWVIARDYITLYLFDIAERFLFHRWGFIQLQ